MSKREHKERIKKLLVDNLKQEKAFWSFNSDSMSADIFDDETIIAYTLRYLDLKEINLLFSIYPLKKIKTAWINRLVPEGEFLYTLNRFLAWYYFKAKKPDTYLKSIQTRHLNKLFS